MTTSPRIAYYPGSFDPMTNGHLDILEQALSLADKVIVAIGTHSSKTGLFSFDERKALIEAVMTGRGRGDEARIDVTAFNNLVVDAARDAGASILIRGLRDGTDLDYEMQMAGMNGAMAPEVDVYATAPGADLAASMPVGTFEFKGDLGPVEVPAGDYQVLVTEAGDAAAIVFDSGTVSLADGDDPEDPGEPVPGDLLIKLSG